MLEIKQTNPVEVKRYFLFADAFKGPAKKHKEIGISGLEKEYQKIKQEIWNLEESQLNEKITDKVRLKRYDSMEWYMGDRALDQAGVWPEMRGLDITLTIGNVPETTTNIKKVLEGKLNLELPEKFRIKLDSLREITEFVYSNFPLIFFPGGEVREKDHNTWAREEGTPLCKIFRYDIDDGCVRAVVYWLEGFKETPTLFARYKKD